MASTTLPLFSYLSHSYHGDYLHINNNIIYHLNILPRECFSTTESLQKVYNKINKLLKLMGYKLTISQEIAHITYNNGELFHHFLHLPIEILNVQVGDTKYILRPVIETVTVSTVGHLQIVCININFQKSLAQLNYLKQKSHTSISRL